MKKIYNLLGLLMVVLILGSCATSESVVTNKQIQKRKYNKGFYAHKVKGKKVEKADRVIISDINETLAKNPSVLPQSEILENRTIIRSEQTTLALSPSAFKAVATTNTKQGSNAKKAVKQTLADSGISLKDKLLTKKLTNEIISGKITHPISKNAGGKSQLIALIICIFLGGIGIHRFYLGYTLEGVIQLLTLGGCGIWALIDLVRIITGDLQPKDGPYDETL